MRVRRSRAQILVPGTFLVKSSVNYFSNASLALDHYVMHHNVLIFLSCVTQGECSARFDYIKIILRHWHFWIHFIMRLLKFDIWNFLIGILSRKIPSSKNSEENRFSWKSWSSTWRIAPDKKWWSVGSSPPSAASSRSGTAGTRTWTRASRRGRRTGRGRRWRRRFWKPRRHRLSDTSQLIVVLGLLFLWRPWLFHSPPFSLSNGLPSLSFTALSHYLSSLAFPFVYHCLLCSLPLSFSLSHSLPHTLPVSFSIIHPTFSLPRKTIKAIIYA